VSQRVALELADRLQDYQRGGLVPSGQTCDLIILDRSVASPLLLRVVTERALHACPTPAVASKHAISFAHMWLFGVGWKGIVLA
jgi:hypothetical protein